MDPARGSGCGVRGGLRSFVVGVSLAAAAQRARASCTGAALFGSSKACTEQTTTSRPSRHPVPAAAAGQWGAATCSQLCAPARLSGGAKSRPCIRRRTLRWPGSAGLRLSRRRQSQECLSGCHASGTSWRLAQSASRRAGAGSGADVAQRSELQPASSGRSAALVAAVASSEPDAGRAAPAAPGSERDAGAHVAAGAHGRKSCRTPSCCPASGPPGHGQPCLPRLGRRSARSAADGAELQPIPGSVQPRRARYS
jgi:hypothetical protein